MGQPLTAAVRFLSGEREPVRVATTGNITMQGLRVIDDVELEVGDRVLVKDQTDQKQNGIYLASEGRWFRAPDASWTRSINQGVTVQVQEGTANHNKTYRFDTQDPEVGVDPIVISYFLSSNLTEELQAILDSATTTAAELATQGAEAAVQPFVDAAEAAADAAGDYADFARNNWAVIGPFVGTGEEEDYLLSIDPGSENNMFVVVGGVSQLKGSYALVHDGSDAFIRINVPEDVPFEVRVSNAIPVGAPSDGSVTTAKLANNSVSFARLQDIETLRLLGRVAAGSGDPEEITAAQLRDMFLPAGSVIDSVSGAYTTSADITGAGSVIPIDDTVPQITEGTQIISVSITPKSATNKLRIRYSGVMSVNQVSAVGAAVFNGAAGAIHASMWACPVANYYQHICGEVEYTPGATTPQTISLRVGPSTSTHVVRMNGGPSARVFGGAAATRLIVEEIKG